MGSVGAVARVGQSRVAQPLEPDAALLVVA